MTLRTLLMTDSQGSVLGTPRGFTRSYTPYGYHRADDQVLLGFAGQALDRFTRHYHLGNGRRAYSPALMRFLTPDRLSPFDEGGLNAYAYCLGDPVNHIDPSGESAEDYLLPALSILVNVMGLMTSGLRIRSMIKISKALHLKQLPITPSLEKPRTMDWVVSSVSTASSAAGAAVGGLRTAEPENDWQLWPLTALTVISVLTSAAEVWKLYRARPWKDPVTLQQTRQPVDSTPRTLHRR